MRSKPRDCSRSAESMRASLYSRLFAALHMHQPVMDNDVLISGRSTTYLKGVTDALFLDFRNYHNRTENKNKCRGDSHGVYHILSVVCREGRVPSGTLYGCLYTSAWDVSLSVFLKGCGRPRTANRQMQAPTFFFFVVSHIC